MITLICVCDACNMEYEISFEKQNFYEPEYCAGCGISDCLESTIK